MDRSNGSVALQGYLDRISRDSLSNSVDTRGLRRMRSNSRTSKAESQNLDASIGSVGGDALFGSWRGTRAEIRRLQAGLSDISAEEGVSLRRNEDDSPSVSPFINMVSWLQARIGTRFQMGIIIAYVVISVLRQCPLLGGGEPTSNPSSLLVIGNLISLFTSVTIAFSIEGREACPKVFSWYTFWRFFFVASLFTTASTITISAGSTAAKRGAVVALGYIYLPTAAVLSVFVLKRTYGRLECVSLMIMSCTLITFSDLHLTGAGTKGDVLAELDGGTIVLVLVGAIVSALASTIAERLYKNRSRGVAINQDVEHRFYIYKTHLDFAGLLVSIVIWTLSVSVVKEVPGIDVFKDGWFGTWGAADVIHVFLAVIQAWLTGLVVKNFSTVFRSVTESLILVVFVFFTDVVLDTDTDHGFKAGKAVCFLLMVMLIFSALIFQTGRLNIKALRESMRLQSGAAGHTSGVFGSVATLAVATADRVRVDRKFICTAGVLVCFIASDAARTLAQSEVLNKSAVNTTSFVLANYIAGVVIGTLLTLSNKELRWTHLKKGFSFWRIARCLPCACLFCLAQCLQSLAYGFGISAALSTALGYVYIPISALASFFVLGKYYMWLEWFALITLMLASITYGLLSSSSTAVGQASPLLPSAFVLGSVCSSVAASLAAEKIFKSDDLPFYVQKISLDFGGAMATIPLMGLIGIVSSRPQDAFWKERPLEPIPGRTIDHWCSTDFCSSVARSVLKACVSNCTTTHTMQGMQACSCNCQYVKTTCSVAPIAPWHCDCGSGVWVGWDSAPIWLTLCINICQGWLVGIVIKQFSTVTRAIGQSSTLLVIYFIGTPLVNWLEGREPIFGGLTPPATLVCFIIPMCTATFMFAVAEMEKVMELAAGADQAPAAAGHSSITLLTQPDTSEESLTESFDASELTRD